MTSPPPTSSNGAVLRHGLRDGLRDGLLEGLRVGLRDGLLEGLRVGDLLGLRVGVALREGERVGVTDLVGLVLGVADGLGVGDGVGSSWKLPSPSSGRVSACSLLLLVHHRMVCAKLAGTVRPSMASPRWNGRQSASVEFACGQRTAGAFGGSSPKAVAPRTWAAGCSSTLVEPVDSPLAPTKSRPMLRHAAFAARRKKHRCALLDVSVTTVIQSPDEVLRSCR